MSECGKTVKLCEGWIYIRPRKFSGLRKKRVYGAVLKCLTCGEIIVREQGRKDKTPKTHKV